MEVKNWDKCNSEEEMSVKRSDTGLIKMVGHVDRRRAVSQLPHCIDSELLVECFHINL